MQTIGETRAPLAVDMWNKVEEVANKMKHIDKPFYIVYYAKPDPNLKGAQGDGKTAIGGLRYTIKMYYQRPPFILGLLVWKVDNAKGLFEFIPELSSPPDNPIHPSLLSTRAEDKSAVLMGKAKQMNKIIPLVS